MPTQRSDEAAVWSLEPRRGRMHHLDTIKMICVVLNDMKVQGPALMFLRMYRLRRFEALKNIQGGPCDALKMSFCKQSELEKSLNRFLMVRGVIKQSLASCLLRAIQGQWCSRYHLRAGNCNAWSLGN